MNEPPNFPGVPESSEAEVRDSLAEDQSRSTVPSSTRSERGERRAEPSSSSSSEPCELKEVPSSPSEPAVEGDSLGQPNPCPEAAVEARRPSSGSNGQGAYWEASRAWAQKPKANKRKSWIFSARASNASQAEVAKVSSNTTSWFVRRQGIPKKQVHLSVEEVRETIMGVRSETSSSTIGGEGDSWRAKAHHLVEHRYFQLAICTIIVLNALYIGIETDNKNWSESARIGFEALFATIFLIEIALRLSIGARRFFCGSPWDRGWNVFDLLLVIIACIDLFVITVFFRSAAEDLEALSVVRMLRLLRIARVLRLLQFFKELWLLVAGVIDAMRTLFWAWLLIFMIVYVFGVLITGTMRELGARETMCEGSDDTSIDTLYGSLPKSMFTLFSVITINGWGELAKCSMQVAGWTWFLFVVFLLCTSFGMLNVVIAVIVEGTLERAMRQQREEAQQEDVQRRDAINQIYEAFHSCDANGDGQLTRLEFMTSLQQTEFMRKLLVIGIDVRKAKNLFDILDYDSSGSLDLQEFIHGMMRARGEAQAKDILALQCDVLRAEQRYREELQTCRDGFIMSLSPLDEQIEAAHKEVRRLLRALEGPGSPGGGGQEQPMLMMSYSRGALEASPLLGATQ